ncbi:NACHT domain-containing protein [Klebsiella quasivariicola]|uniref:NACHT domain-containing protein n=1 Tax=Klebsiella quasivariicola TaxID=2026240 RepID=UPI00247AD5F7|nr:hypothetical protein [Klebsiella quasivariicola]
MANYINVNRRFYKSSNSQEEIPTQIYADWFEDNNTIGWDELLKYSRIIILAEAGAGKTREMKEQSTKLSQAGQFSFFIPTEALAEDLIIDILHPDERIRFEQWENSSDYAYLFLDAVDELKLKGDEFNKLLRKLRRQLERHLSRVNIIMSCRPSDWNSYDFTILDEWLPDNQLSEENIIPISQKSGREFFKDMVSDWFNQPAFSNPLEELEKETEQQSDDYHRLHCFYMRPMTNKQIRKFTCESAVSDPERFLQQLYALDAEVFASRPQDLLSLITYWNTHQKFDSALILLESDIQHRLTENYSRCEKVLKSPQEIRNAIEKLALAMSLTRKLTIGISESFKSDNHSLNPQKILTDWLPKDINTLLRLAIFEPATYERVRFHHRSVLEYLAARRLQHLIKKGMPISACFNLLFSERCNFPVVIPSMRSVTAWLSLWDPYVCKELMNRAPEILLSGGDPGSLPIEVRSELLKNFVLHYKHGTSRGINIPLVQVTRFSHPELQPVIKKLWAEGYQNDDVRELLLEIIWTGKFQDCNALLEQAVYDPGIEITDRLRAIKAIAATDDYVLQQKIVHDVINSSELWPEKFIFHFAEELFPQLLSVDNLLILIKRTTEPKSSTSGFKWTLYNVATEIAPESDAAIAFRDQVTKLILDNNIQETRHYYPTSRYGYLTCALAKICARQLVSRFHTENESLIFSCLVCHFFNEIDFSYVNDDLSVIKNALNNITITTIRKFIFITEWSLLSQIVKHDIDAFLLQERIMISTFNKNDLPWLITLLFDKSSPELRSVLLEFLFRFTPLVDNIPEFHDSLINAVSDDETLLSSVHQWLRPKPIDTESIRRQEVRKEKEKNRQEAEKSRQDEEINKWLIWYDKTTTDSTWMLSDDTQFSVLNHVAVMLQKTHRRYSPEEFWSRDILKKTFSDDNIERIETALREYWRKSPIQLQFEQERINRNSPKRREIIAIMGLLAESDSQGWQKRLNHSEASLAIKYATLLQNNFTPFINELAITFPDIVKEIIGSELQYAIHHINNGNHFPIISQVASADITLRKLLSDGIFNAANNYLLAVNKATINSGGSPVEKILMSLIDVISDDKKKVIAHNCVSAYKIAPYNPEYYAFLRYAFIFSPEVGMETFQCVFRKYPEKDSYITGLYATLFSHQASRRHQSPFYNSDISQQISMTGKLLDIAYQFIRREDDREHDDIFTPDLRDKAEEARGALLDRLLNISNDKTVTEIIRLAKQPHFYLSKARFEYLARERAALNSDNFSLTEEDSLRLESYLEQPPHHQEALYQIMINRLQDLQFALSHSDFTDRDILRAVTLEEHMQPTLAWRLEASSKSAYSVVRESEVADGKKTDIRLLSPCGKHKAVIEVKLADKRWSIADFERALEHQLVGQYLRYDGCKTGCLLLTYNGNKKYWQNPITRKRLYFKDLIEYLNVKANKIMSENSSLKLIVIGLDLTSPYLVPVHK